MALDALVRFVEPWAGPAPDLGRPMEVASRSGCDLEPIDPTTESGPWTYRLGGPTCLAGDVVGDFAFHRELKIGDILVFDDMAHYTMVKTTTFNGVKHPAIALQHDDGKLEILREFTYADFRDRLS